MAVSVSQLVQKIVVQGDTEAKAKLSGMHQAAEETSGGFKGMLASALSFAGGQAIFNLVGQSVGFLKDQLTDCFKESMDAQAGMAQTEAVIKSTGDASGMSAQQIADMASNLSHLTKFSDDTIQSGENMLLTFTNIGKDVFPQATKSLLDLAQAMGGDLKGAAIQEGKALNDPIQGVTALTRVGVTFTAQQKEQIKAMQDAGNMAGAQNIILKELNKEFGGSAEAAGKTFGGQLTILKQKLSDVKQNIGDALMPVLQMLVPMVGRVADALSSKAFTDFVTGAGKMIVQAFKDIGDFVTPLIPKFLDIAKNFSKMGDAFKDPIFAKLAKDIGGDLKKGLEWLINALASKQFGDFCHLVGVVMADAIKFVIPLIMDITANIIKFASDIYTRVKPDIDNFMKWWNTNWPHVRDVLKGVWEEIVGVVKIAWAIVSGFIKIALDIFNGDWKKAWEDTKKMLSDVWEGIKTYLSGALDIVKGMFGFAWQALADTIGKPFTDAWATISGVFDNIQNAIRTLTGQGPAVAANTANIMTGIHHFASGIENFGGGLAYVHAGEILTYLPKGSNVIPASNVPSFLGSGSHGNQSSNTTVQVFIGTRDITDIVQTKTLKGTRTGGPLRANL